MEVGVHLAIYERFAGVTAVVHAHPPAIQALSELDLEPRCGLLVEGRDLLGSVVTVAYHPPGSVALARGVVAGLESCSACVLAQHGALTVGATTLEALRRMLLLERLAVITAEVDAR
jgi:L-fuculose-phosphate aldolase